MKCSVFIVVYKACEHVKMSCNGTLCSVKLLYASQCSLLGEVKMLYKYLKETYYARFQVRNFILGNY